MLDAPHEWIRARVRRARVLQDSFEELNSLGDTFFFARAILGKEQKKSEGEKIRISKSAANEEALKSSNLI